MWYPIRREVLLGRTSQAVIGPSDDRRSSVVEGVLAIWRLIRLGQRQFEAKHEKMCMGHTGRCKQHPVVLVMSTVAHMMVVVGIGLNRMWVLVIEVSMMMIRIRPGVSMPNSGRCGTTGQHGC